MTGDLHTHTHLSDGSMTRDELVRYAKMSGLGFIGITDHDTLLTKKEAEELSDGIEVLGGAEFSCVDENTGRKVHILCFLADNEEKLISHCEKIQILRDKAGMQMAREVAKLYPFDMEDIIVNKGISKSVFKQHIMYELMERGYVTEIYGEMYRKLFGRNGVCYESVPYPTVNEMLDLIKQCGGVAILAHPKVYDSMDLALKLAKQGRIDGIEVHHYSANEDTENKLLKICNDYNLIITGGSDYHGIYNSTPRTVGYRRTDISQLNRIKELKNGR